MGKAYDLQDLLEKLKAAGLDLAEDAAKGVVSAVLDWVSDSAKASENQIDDILAPVLMAAKPAIMAELDKIDGKVGDDAAVEAVAEKPAE